jgi:hypothetical protein
MACRLKNKIAKNEGLERHRDKGVDEAGYRSCVELHVKF